MTITVRLRDGTTAQVDEDNVGRFVAANRTRVQFKTCPTCRGQPRVVCNECLGMFVVPETC